MLIIDPIELSLGPPPEDPRHFSRDVEIVVEAAEDFRRYTASFSMQVCTPSWLSDKALSAGWTWGRRRLVLPQWDPVVIQRAVESLLASGPALTWMALMRELKEYWESDELPDSSDAAAS